MSARNFYDELEVSPAASAEVIRAAYKSLMQRYHPDKNPGVTEIAQRAAAIAQAYDVLSDPHKREAYDRTLLPAASSEPTRGMGGAAMARVAQRPVRQQDAAGWNVWYVWLLIASIVASGWGIHVLTKNRASSESVAPESLPRGSAVSTELQIRTIPAFVTNLSVDLASATGAGESARVLFIPEIVLRLEIEDAARWARKIEQERASLTQQLIARLARASYDELAGTEGDLVLRRLIEDTLSAGAGLHAVAPPPMGADAAPLRPKPLRALLPQLYSVK